MWKKLVDMTMEQNQRNYDRLNISLSNRDIMGESCTTTCCRRSLPT